MKGRKCVQDIACTRCGVRQVEDCGNGTFQCTVCGWSFTYDEALAKGCVDPAENKEAVNHPVHYNPGTYETIKVIDAWDLDFYLGNVIKYISRAGKKDPAKTLEDLQKAKWYLDSKIIKMQTSRRP